MHKLIKELKETNPKLNDFLVKKRLRTKFLKNYGNYSTDDNLTSISHAFIWSDTPEGGKFWSALNNEFNSL